MNQLLRVYRIGSSRTVNVTKLFPDEWRAVMAEVVERGDNYVIVKFRVVVKDEKYGRPVTTDSSVVE